jgi:hypothetical protein
MYPLKLELIMTDKTQQAIECNKALFASPVDAPRDRLADLVPFNAKKLAMKARKFLTLSAVYAEREAFINPLHEPLPKRPIYPSWTNGTRQSHCMPFESGPNVLPGLEEFASQVRQ